MAAAMASGLLHSGAFADTVAGDNPTANAAVAKEGLFDAPMLGSVDLEASRGGAELQVLNKGTLDGVVSDNQAYNLTTGSNWITAGSFAGASGLSTVIQNSGNNVLLQNATIVNLQVQ